MESAGEAGGAVVTRMPTKYYAWYEDARTGRRVRALGKEAARRLLGMSDRQSRNYMNRLEGEYAVLA